VDDTIRIIEGFTRNLGIPDEWVLRAKAGEIELYNAARPFPAHQTEIGEFVHGVFYGLIDPKADYADDYRKRAAELDAYRIEFISKATVETWGHAYCEQYGVNYDDYKFSDIAKSWLRHARQAPAQQQGG